MIKMLSLVSRMALAMTIFSVAAYGDDVPAPQTPVIPQEIKLTPEMQAMLGELMKMLNPDQNGNPQAGTTDANKMAPLIAQLLKSLGSDQGGNQGGNQGGKVDPNKLAPLISQLMKMLDTDSTDDSKPAPNHDSSSSTSTQSNSQATNTQKSEQTPGLQTHSLRSSSSLVTNSLGGPRMTNDQWRDLFPVRH